MTNDDLNKLANLVDERINKALEPVKQDLSVLKQDVAGVKKDVGDLKQDVGSLKRDVSTLKEDLKDVKEVQEKSVLPSVSYIEKNIKAYKDAYQNNNANVRKLEKRVEVLEDNAGIVPSAELILVEVN